MPLQTADTALVHAWVATAREDVAVLCMRLAEHDLSPSEWATQTATVLEELEEAVSAHALRAWPTVDAPALHLAGELATKRAHLAALAPQAAFLPDAALAALPAQLVPVLLDAATLDARRPKDGRNGQDGQAGRNGVDGSPGERGPEGAKGADGRDGLDGRAGVDGKDGARGPQGEPGVRGPQGERGLAGPPGRDGQDGISAVRWRGQWTARTAYVRGDIVGYRGSSYVALVEHTGRRPSESPGTWDLVAAKGDKGDRGPRGPAGKDGARGPGGIGGAGMTGPQGPPGPPGPPGSGSGTPTTVDVGTTTTGAAGTDAAVANSGTSTAVVLDFTIPRGDTGAQGIQGIQGIQGDPGATGATGSQGPQGDPGATGATGPAGPALIPTSTAASPGIPTAGDADSGFYATAGGLVGVTRNGAKVVEVDTTGLDVTGAVTASVGVSGGSQGAASAFTVRKLGTGATDATAGNDSRLSDSRVPTGTAGGDLAGTYPNPTLRVLPDVCAVALGAQAIPSGIETPLFFGGTDEDDADNQHFTSDANLTGTVAKTASSTALVGTGTLFTSELSVGQIIIVPGTAEEKRVVTVITDNTHLTVNAAFANSGSGQTARRCSSGIVIRTAGVYQCQGNALFAANNTGTVRAFELYMQRGATRTVLAASQMPPITAIYGVGVTVGKRQRFLQWDFVEYVVFHNIDGGAGATLITGTIPLPTLSLVYVRA